MVSHGLVSAALFLIVGVVYERKHSRSIADYSGLANTMPKYSAFFMLFMLASVGLPGTSGFVGEFLVILSTIKISIYLTIFTAVGVVVGAAYMLLLYKNINFGQVNNNLKEMKDLNFIEISYFTIISIMVVVLGIYPKLLLKLVDASISLSVLS